MSMPTGQTDRQMDGRTGVRQTVTIRLPLDAASLTTDKTQRKREGVIDVQSGELEQEEVMGEGIGKSERKEMVPE